MFKVYSQYTGRLIVRLLVVAAFSFVCNALDPWRDFLVNCLYSSTYEPANENPLIVIYKLVTILKSTVLSASSNSTPMSFQLDRTLLNIFCQNLSAVRQKFTGLVFPQHLLDHINIICTLLWTRTSPPLSMEFTQLADASSLSLYSLSIMSSKPKRPNHLSWMLSIFSTAWNIHILQHISRRSTVRKWV